MARFHIHVDAASLSPEFEEYLSSELGFRRTDFVALDGGDAEPKNHLTLKLDAAADFRRSFDSVVARAQSSNGLVGYVEGEFIALDHDFPETPYRGGVPLPFKLSLRHLPPGCFRESEIHVSLCRTRTDPRLLADLSAIGLAIIYIPKPWGISIIFTAQGTRETMSTVSRAIRDYIEAVGGAVMGSMKEERIARWWVSGAEVNLPPVIHEVLSGSEPGAEHGASSALPVTPAAF